MFLARDLIAKKQPKMLSFTFMAKQPEGRFLALILAKNLSSPWRRRARKAIIDSGTKAACGDGGDCDCFKVGAVQGAEHGKEVCGGFF